jgi:serine phosphatase RsbU (regulator of sigma subunit)
MSSLWHTLTHLGDDPRLPDYLRRKLYLSNLIAATLTALCLVTLLGLYFGLSQLSSSALLGLMVSAFGLLLNFLGFFQVTRWLLVTAPAAVLAFEAALVTPAEVDIPPIRLMILAMIALPAILFDTRERREMAVALAVPVLLFLGFEPLNDLLRRGQGIHSSAGVAFRIAGFFFSITLIISAVLYMRHINQRAEGRISELLEVTLQQKEELRATLEVVEEQKQEITDSIKYAKRIQMAILPYLKALDQFPIQNYVIYNPRDIVSGDFYWYSITPGVLRIAAVDCTGHGVPGAFMSVLGNTVLNQIANTQREISPEDTLELLHAGVVRALQQDRDKPPAPPAPGTLPSLAAMGPLDGMDIALVHFLFDQRKLLFAGAQRPLWVVRGAELIEIKGSKRPIGGGYHEGIPFQRHEMDLQPGDRIYLFSDGIPDQVGGPDRKKFSNKRLSEFLLETRHLSLEAQREVFEQRIAQWQGAFEQVDDQLLMAIEYKG